MKGLEKDLNLKEIGAMSSYMEKDEYYKLPPVLQHLIEELEKFSHVSVSCEYYGRFIIYGALHYDGLRFSKDIDKNDLFFAEKNDANAYVDFMIEGIKEMVVSYLKDRIFNKGLRRG